MQPSARSHQPPQDYDSTPSSTTYPCNPRLITPPLIERSGPVISNAHSERDALHAGVPPPKNQPRASLSSPRRNFSKGSKAKTGPPPSKVVPTPTPARTNHPQRNLRLHLPPKSSWETRLKYQAPALGRLLFSSRTSNAPPKTQTSSCETGCLSASSIASKRALRGTWVETHFAEITDVKQEE